MLMLQTTPDTSGFLMLWFAVLIIVGGGWLFSLYQRRQQLHRDRAVIEDLLKEIQLLPANSRAVFSMYVIDGYKHREIAEILEININTSKWHVAEAKKLLKKKIQSTVDGREFR